MSSEPSVSRASSSSRSRVRSVSTTKYADSVGCSWTARRHDHAGQAHAADGGPEQLGLGAVRRQRADLAVGRRQVHRPDVVAEAALGVVVLAVDVGADRAADRDLAGARQHRHPPAERQGGAHQGVQADPAVDDRDARVGVDRGRAGEPGHVQHGAAGVLRRVAVGAAEAAGDHPARSRSRDRGRHVGGGAGDGDVREGRGGAAPAVQARRSRSECWASRARLRARRRRPTTGGRRGTHLLGCRTACVTGARAGRGVRSGCPCDARGGGRSSRRRPAIVGAGRYDPPDRRSGTGG